MKVQLNAGHIVDGVRGSTCRCPVALALAEAGIEWPEVGRFPGLIRFRAGGFWMKIQMPPSVVSFVDAFDGDHAGELEPFEFDLHIEEATEWRPSNV